MVLIKNAELLSELTADLLAKLYSNEYAFDVDVYVERLERFKITADGIDYDNKLVECIDSLIVTAKKFN